MAKASLELARVIQGVKDGFKIPPSDMALIGEDMARKIRVRSRLGRDTNNTAFKALSPSYLAYRRKYRGFMSGETSISRSNVTFTGQLLDSMVARSGQANTFVIEFNESRKTNVLLKNSIVTNSEVVASLELGGRKFFGFTREDTKYLVNLLIGYFKESFKL